MKYDEYKNFLEKGKHFTKDPLSDRVKKLFEKRDIKYPPEWCSIACFFGDVPKSNAVRAYGNHIVELRPEILLPAMFVIASGDIQDQSKSKNPDLVGLNGDDSTKLKIIKSVISRVPDESRVRYAEARILRAILKTDVIRWNCQ